MSDNDFEHSSSCLVEFEQHLLTALFVSFDLMISPTEDLNDATLPSQSPENAAKIDRESNQDGGGSIWASEDRNNQSIRMNTEESREQQQTEPHNNTSSEYSYVFVSADSSKEPAEMNNSNDSSVASDEVANDQESTTQTISQRSEASSTLSITTSNSSRRSSIQEKLIKSGSRMPKPNNGVKNDHQGSNLPSTFANALSSLTSFTSSFSLSNSSTLNGLLNNNNSANLTIETASTSSRLNQVNESKCDLINRKAAQERKNLINLTKLIVKDLISSSLVSGRTIENEYQSVIHLNNYFTLIDRVLKHGLKHNLLSNRSANLWTALDNLPKYLKESTLMSESIQSLVHTKTPDGKIKAWIRLAMMQKKLPEYFNELLAQKVVLLKDIYHDYAFMLNDESHVFAGLIIGVNVIDCNFFVKNDNFDSMDEIIDLGPYLRSVNSFDEASNDSIECANSSEQINNLTKVLDQKNYLEEWNKHLESTISNLNAKIKILEEQNSHLEMEAKVSEVRIAKLQEKRNDTSNSAQTAGSASNSKPILTSGSLPISDAIKSIITRNKPTNNFETNTHSSNISATSASLQNAEADTRLTSETSSSINNEISVTQSLIITEKPAQEAKSTEVQQKQPVLDASQLSELENYKSKVGEQEKELVSLRERIGILETSYRGALDKIRTLERDLDIQTSMNSDKETTIKIYEKDIRQKQQQVETLRASLVDAKKLNSDLSDRLTDTGNKLKSRVVSVTQLQSSLDKWKLENKALASRLQDKQTAFTSLAKDLEKAMDQIKELKKYNERINDELKRERECGQSSSVAVEEQNAIIAELTEKLESFEKELNNLHPYKEQHKRLKKLCQEYEQSLEEVGAQLRESRLEVESLKENSSVFLDSQWMDSKQVKQCALCQQLFSVTRRKHHCRLCGNVFCQTCSDNKMELASSAKAVRVCDTCHAFLLAKFVKSSSSASTM